MPYVNNQRDQFPPQKNTFGWFNTDFALNTSRLSSK